MRIRLVGIIAVFVLGSIPSPALAHTSSYCGHGTDGFTEITQFNSSHRHWYTIEGRAYFEHHHKYSHYNWDGVFKHKVYHKQCPKH